MQEALRKYGRSHEAKDLTSFIPTCFSIHIMPPMHLEQVLVDEPKLADGLNAFADLLTTSYFYPSGSYEKCEDSRAPHAWATISPIFEPYIKVSN